MKLLFSLPGGGEWLFIAGLILLIPLIALIDILKSDFKDSTNKLVWVLVVIMLPLLGPVLYYFLGRSQKRSSLY
ncbi:MAG: PLDc_N domain-containing protein [Sphingobacteriales bacterium]|nr:MAG: PLDc_N domain-containing protein [Sphingobacteriales bacterium]